MDYSRKIIYSRFLPTLVLLFCIGVCIFADYQFYKSKLLLPFIIFLLPTLYLCYSLVAALTYRIYLTPKQLEEYIFFKKISAVSIHQISALKESSFEPLLEIFATISAHYIIPILKIEAKAIFYPIANFFYYFPTLLENLRRRETWGKTENNFWLPLFPTNINALVSYISHINKDLYVDTGLMKYLSSKTKEEIHKRYS